MTSEEEISDIFKIKLPNPDLTQLKISCHGLYVIDLSRLVENLNRVFKSTLYPNMIYTMVYIKKTVACNEGVSFTM